MFRTIKNLILLVIICVTATGLPVYANFVFNYVLSEDYAEYHVNIIDHASDNYEVEITFSSQHNNLPLEFTSDAPFDFKLYIDDMEIKNATLDVLEKSKDPLILAFTLSPQSLNIPNGDYTLKAQPKIKNITKPTDPIEINFNLSSNLSYIPAVENIGSNRTALTLYFPDNEWSNLIPITRVIPYTNMPLRATINELYLGPKPSIGLPTESPIPRINDLNLNRDIARLFLPSDMGVYTDFSTNARIAFDSFVKSLTSINEVSAVQFYINRLIVSESFHGISVDKPIYEDISPKMYVGYKTDTNRILLLPIVSNNRDLAIKSQLIEKTFEELKHSTNVDLYSHRIHPPIPEGVDLLNYNLSNNILSLTFNEKFINLLEDTNDMGGFMLDALLHTYTSFPDVDSVKFSVEGSQTENNILNTPMKASRYFNLEN